MIISSASAIEHCLRHAPERIHELWFTGNEKTAAARCKELIALAKGKNIPFQFGKKMEGSWVQARLEPFRYAAVDEWMAGVERKKKSLVLALDHLQDPQNFGALVRTAEGFGFDGVLIPKDRSVQVTEGVYNASVGAVETIPIVQIANLPELLRKLKAAGYWVVATAIGPEAKPPEEMPSFEKIVLVLGTELSGISEKLLKECDWQTMLPMRGHVQSFNVSVSGGIFMYELCRRTNKT